AAVICFARVRVDQLTRGSFLAFLLATASVFALLTIGLPIAGKFIANDVTRFRVHRRVRWWALPAVWAVVALAGIAGSAIVALLAYEGQLVRDSLQPSYALGLIARAAD